MKEGENREETGRKEGQNIGPFQTSSGLKLTK
jgi:hypothetical protein